MRDCKWSFTMKLVKNEHRSQMNISTLAKVMFISILGPKVADFDPEECIESWLQLAEHLPYSVWHLEKSFFICLPLLQNVVLFQMIQKTQFCLFCIIFYYSHVLDHQKFKLTTKIKSWWSTGPPLPKWIFESLRIEENKCQALLQFHPIFSIKIGKIQYCWHPI